MTGFSMTRVFSWVGTVLSPGIATPSAPALWRKSSNLFSPNFAKLFHLNP